MAIVEIECSNPFTLVIHQPSCPILAKHTIRCNRYSLYHGLAAQFILYMRYRLSGKPTFGLSQTRHNDPHISVHKMTVL